MKKINKIGILSLAIGAIIGWGAFVLPGTLFIKEVGFLNSSIGLFFGALIMIIIEKNYGYMIKRYPVSGGEFAYTYKFFGRKHAFIAGWFLVLAYMSIVPLNATALALIAKTLFSKTIQIGLLYEVAGYPIYLLEILLSSFALIIFAYFNIKGIKWSSYLQTIMVLILVGVVFYMGGYALYSKFIDKKLLLTQISYSNINIKSIFKILVIAPWAYIGFDTIPQVAEDINFPEEQASILAIMSILVGCAIYILLNLLTAINFTKEILNNKDVLWATGQSVEIIFGKIGLYVLGIALLMAIVAGINGFYIATSKLIYSMARGKALPSWFEVVDSKSKAPKNAIIFIMILSLITPWFGRKVLIWIVDMSSIGAAIGYLYTCIAVYNENKKFKNLDKYKVYGLLGSIFSMTFIIFLLIPYFPGSLTKPSYVLLLLWGILGIIFYSIIDEKYMKISKKDLDYLILKKS